MLNSRKGQSSSLVFTAALSMANKASLRSRVENLLEKKPGVSKVSSLIVMTILTVSASAALAINLVRPDMKHVSLERDLGEKTVLPDLGEVNLRLTANPFPGE